MPETLHLTPTETLTIVTATPDLVEVEASYGPKGSPPPKHLHPDQDEHFEVRSGELTVRVDGEERKLAAGDAIDIPRETVHQMWNSGAEPATVVWQTRPALRTEQWFRAIDVLNREGGGAPSPVAMAPLLEEYRDVFRLALAPDPVQRPLLKLLGAVGRLRR
jgi:quercetin dioxygenase-like cupin family protein